MNRCEVGLLALLVGALAIPAVADDPVAMEKELAGRRLEVASALMKLPRMPGPFDYVSFVVSGSVVTLQGFTTGASMKSDAEKVVERLDWVTEVENEIEFHQSEPQANQIREEVLAALVDKVPDAFSERYPDLWIQVDPELNVKIVGSLTEINRKRYESALVTINQLPLVKSVDDQVLFKKKR
jgi:hypothetical protein